MVKKINGYQKVLERQKLLVSYKHETEDSPACLELQSLMSNGELATVQIMLEGAQNLIPLLKEFIYHEWERLKIEPPIKVISEYGSGRSRS